MGRGEAHEAGRSGDSGHYVRDGHDADARGLRARGEVSVGGRDGRVPPVPHHAVRRLSAREVVRFFRRARRGLRADRVGRRRHGLERDRVSCEGERGALGDDDLLFDASLAARHATHDEAPSGTLHRDRRLGDGDVDPGGRPRAGRGGRIRPRGLPPAARCAQDGLRPGIVLRLDGGHLLHDSRADRAEPRDVPRGGGADHCRGRAPQLLRLPERLLADAAPGTLLAVRRDRCAHGGDRGRDAERRHGGCAGGRGAAQYGRGAAGERLLDLDELLRIDYRELLEQEESEMKRLIEAIRNAKHVGCLTGAGVSTLCGIPDFRGPQGLYKQKDAERIFDIDWFDRDPSIYYTGCAELVYGLNKFQPGPVHHALKHLEDLGHLKGIATQNIDMLHQKAGSSNVYEVHGSPIFHHCRQCGNEKTFDEIMELLKGGGIPRCRCGGAYKPDITFFGEALPERAFAAAQSLAIKSDVFLVLGTSLTVFPAAGLPRLTLQAGGKVFIVNGQPTSLDDYAAGVYHDLTEFAEAILKM